MPECVPPSATGYTRVSTAEQARHGVSLADQEHRIREFCAERGWELQHVYVDRGISGSVPFAQRPAGAHAFASDTDLLVVYDWDRLGRDAADLLASYRDREVVSVTQDGEPPLLRDLRAVLAQEEKRKIHQRTKDAADALARAGRYNGPRPCGYRFANGLLAVIPHEAEVVRRIFAEFLSGSALKAIAIGLNASDIKTSRDGRWRGSSIKGILSNPLYIGRVRYGGEEFPGQHEAIIDPETWAKAQAQLTARSQYRGKGRGRPPAGNHLFRKGMLRCGECGEAMVPRTNRGHTGQASEDYYCNGRLSFGPDFCSVARSAAPTLTQRCSHISPTSRSMSMRLGRSLLRRGIADSPRFGRFARTLRATRSGLESALVEFAGTIRTGGSTRTTGRSSGSS
jgi:site-specific DNA recombinase